MTVETCVRIDSQILMSNVFFWLEITFAFSIQRKCFGLEAVIKYYQFPVHCGMNTVNVTADAKLDLLPSTKYLLS